MKRVPAISLSLIATAVAVRASLIFRYRFDSDEPQHMHVAWGWAHGLAQYRDVFDNHMPLFHLLSSPLFAATGDDPRLLFAARLSMMPLFLGALVLVWRIARNLFDETTAWWSTALAAVVPPFFLGSLEYRTDDLWLVFWLGVIAVAVGNSPPTRKAALGGLPLGGAFGVSMKSTLFVAVLVIAVIATLLLTMRRAPLPPLRLLGKCALIAAATPAIIPALNPIGFAVAGLWRPFVYGVFEHNATPFVHAWHVLWFIPLYFFIRFVALRIARADAEQHRGRPPPARGGYDGDHRHPRAAVAQRSRAVDRARRGSRRAHASERAGDGPQRRDRVPQAPVLLRARGHHEREAAPRPDPRHHRRHARAHAHLRRRRRLAAARGAALRPPLLRAVGRAARGGRRAPAAARRSRCIVRYRRPRPLRRSRRARRGARDDRRRQRRRLRHQPRGGAPPRRRARQGRAPGRGLVRHAAQCALPFGAIIPPAWRATSSASRCSERSGGSAGRSTASGRRCRGWRSPTTSPRPSCARTA